MAYIPMEKLLRKDTSLFKLILTAAARANELAQGEQPLIQTPSKKVSTIALEEIAAGKVYYKEAKKTQVKKIRGGFISDYPKNIIPIRFLSILQHEVGKINFTIRLSKSLKTSLAGPASMTSPRYMKIT